MLLDAFRRDEDVRDIVSLALVELAGMSVEPERRALDEEIDALSSRIRARCAGLTAGEIPELRPARELYRAIGVDPTRHRPSAEALVRRVLRGEPLPRIAPAVDLANLWAVSSGLPVGLYDTGRIEGTEIVVRRGTPGETFEGIRKPEVRLGGRLVLADRRGPFGNPSSDSRRTAVSGETRGCLFVLFAPTSIEVERLDLLGAWLRERAVAYLGGEARSGVLP